MDAIRKLTKLSSMLALFLGFIVSVGLPTGYFILGYQNQRTVIETEAQMNSIFLSRAIGENPEYWRYEERKLTEILTHYSLKKYDEKRTIVDSDNRIISQGGEAVAPPLLTVSHDLFDSGSVVARIDITTSLRPLLARTLFTAALSLAVGLAVFATLKVFPFRALSKLMRSVYEEKEKALAILNNIPDMAWLKDRESRYIAANGPFTQTCGVTSADLPGKTDLDLWPRDLAEHYRADDSEVMESGSPKQIEEQLIDSQGRMMWILTVKTPIINDRGEVIGTTGIARDITDRKLIEDELQKGRDFYLTLFENFPTLIWRAGTDKKCDYFNRTWLEFTGRDIEQEMGDGWAEGVHPDDLERCFSTYVEAFDKREPFKMEYRLMHRSGTFRWIADYGHPFNDLDGEFSGYIGTCFDITDRKDADEKILQLNSNLELKIEEKTRELLNAQDELVRKEKLAILGQLSGSVGHELRNPLGVMSNAVYFLKMASTDGDGTTREYLDIIKHEIDNSQRIITDLLDFARTKSPQQQLISAGELIALSFDKCAIPERIESKVDIPDSLPQVKIDPQQMVQVFQNLITNAVQAMPDGGRIRLTARHAGAIHDSLLQNPKPETDFIEISVSDSGEGISADNMNKLFQPLFTTKPRGIGLGLVVCRNLVEANGGRIEVESEPGKWSTFRVLLPTGG